MCIRAMSLVIHDLRIDAHILLDHAKSEMFICNFSLTSIQELQESLTCSRFLFLFFCFF